MNQLNALSNRVEYYEYVHNFGGMAQVLLSGENRFLSPCNFKELHVIKRARFTTSTLAASQRSLNSMAQTDRWESRKNLDLCKLKLFRSVGQDNHRISDCGDFIIRIFGGADGVVLHLRTGMLSSWVKVAAPLIRGQDAPLRYRVGRIARHSELPRERFSPLAQMRSANGLWTCLLSGADRKWTAHGQNDEIAE
jgi:hypothetical protein